MQIEVEYSFKSEPRFGQGKPPHPALYNLLRQGRDRYVRRLREFAKFEADLTEIPVGRPRHTEGPYWNNGFLPGFDAVALYGFLATEKPRTYLEIGSGYSTKLAHYAIRTRKLNTRIVSIDPHPRAEIDALCSETIRSPLESLDLRIFERLEKGSIVFFDGSHQCFMGSDVAVFFLEVIPRLRKGVLIHVHDIILPDDYWPEWKDRYYSEQYLLAAWLLGGGKGLKVELPVAFITRDPELRILAAQVCRRISPGIEGHGASFWMRRI
jgi:hypothetical protein